MTKKTTSQKHAALKSLSDSSKNALYRRLQLASEILDDKEYVDRVYGSDPAAIEKIEAECFRDFAGCPGLHALLKAYRANPSEERWAEYHYDWHAMIELSKPEPEASERSERMSWKKRCEELEGENAELKSRIKLLEDMLERVLAKERA